MSLNLSTDGVLPGDPHPLKKNKPKAPYRLATRSWTFPAIIFLVAFFVIPIGANVVRSLTLGDAAVFGIFHYYEKLFFDPYYLGVLYETLKVSIITTIACLLVGYPVALFMVRYAGKLNSVFVFCLIAPLLTSIIMRTFGWNVLLARRGLVNVWLMDWGIISTPINILNEPIAVYIGLVHVLAPFMVLSITAVLQGLDTRIEESARALGAGRFRAFWTVTLPLSMDGIATGCILVFVLTNGSFLTMLLLGGGKVTTLALLIYQQFTVTQDVGFAAAMGNVLLLFALICLVLQARYVRRGGIKS